MDPAMQHALGTQRFFIRAQWERLLRLDRGSSPLARPDALVHLLDTTLDEIFATLPDWSVRRHPSPMPERLCPCGRNPYLSYFAAGRQALNEGLVMVQAQMPGLTAEARDRALACLDQIFNRIARREIAAFCGLCLFKAAAGHPQAGLASGAAAPTGIRPTSPN